MKLAQSLSDVLWVRRNMRQAESLVGVGICAKTPFEEGSCISPSMQGTLGHTHVPFQAQSVSLGTRLGMERQLRNGHSLVRPPRPCASRVLTVTGNNRTMVTAESNKEVDIVIGIKSFIKLQ